MSWWRGAACALLLGLPLPAAAGPQDDDKTAFIESSYGGRGGLHFHMTCAFDEKMYFRPADAAAAVQELEYRFNPTDSWIDATQVAVVRDTRWVELKGRWKDGDAGWWKKQPDRKGCLDLVSADATKHEAADAFHEPPRGDEPVVALYDHHLYATAPQWFEVEPRLAYVVRWDRDPLMLGVTVAASATVLHLQDLDQPLFVARDLGKTAVQEVHPDRWRKADGLLRASIIAGYVPLESGHAHAPATRNIGRAIVQTQVLASTHFMVEGLQLLAPAPLPYVRHTDRCVEHGEDARFFECTWDDGEAELIERSEAYGGFVSSETALVAGATFGWVTDRMLATRPGRRPEFKDWFAYTVAAGATVAEGYLRVQSEQYTTEAVVAGGMIGAANGILWPVLWYRMEKELLLRGHR